MGVFGHAALQQAVYSALTGDTTLMTMISGVYDRVPENAAFPYIALGAIQSRDWSSKTSNGTACVLVLHVWSRGGGRKQSADIMDRVHTLLHQANLSLTGGHNLVMLRFEDADITLQKDGLTYEGAMQFKALVE